MLHKILKFTAQLSRLITKHSTTSIFFSSSCFSVQWIKFVLMSEIVLSSAERKYNQFLQLKLFPSLVQSYQLLLLLMSRDFYGLYFLIDFHIKNSLETLSFVCRCKIPWQRTNFKRESLKGRRRIREKKKWSSDTQSTAENLLKLLTVTQIFSSSCSLTIFLCRCLEWTIIDCWAKRKEKNGDHEISLLSAPNLDISCSWWLFSSSPTLSGQVSSRETDASVLHYITTKKNANKLKDRNMIHSRLTCPLYFQITFSHSKRQIRFLGHWLDVLVESVS